jgi:hypothetical protein
MLRSDIINKFIEKRNYKTYLEIGTRLRKSNFDLIKCQTKMCIDPDQNSDAYLQLTSDEFFKINRMTFDVIFIDGLHEGHQVFTDIKNSLRFLNPNGIIICHDCNPLTLEANVDPDYYDGLITWNGDSWKGFVKYRFCSPYLCYVINEDEGCGIIDTTKPTEVQEQSKVYISELNFEMLKLNRNFFIDLRVYNEELL